MDGVSVIVGDDLHFDVASTGDQPFQKNCGVSERFKGFAAGGLECVQKLIFTDDLANSVPTASGRGFDQQRKAETASMGRTAP